MRMVLWGLWTQRNNILWNHANLSPSRVVVDYLYFIHDWLLTTTGLLSVCSYCLSAHLAPASLMWCRPMVGFCKCNCDAAIFQASGITGPGCILINS